MLSTIGFLVPHTAGMSSAVIIVGIVGFTVVSVVRSVLAFILMDKALDKLGDADARNRATVIDALATMWRKRRDKR